MSLGHDSDSSPTLEDWEYMLVRSVAARIRTTEREDRVRGYDSRTRAYTTETIYAA